MANHICRLLQPAEFERGLWVLPAHVVLRQGAYALSAVCLQRLRRKRQQVRDARRMRRKMSWVHASWSKSPCHRLRWRLVFKINATIEWSVWGLLQAAFVILSHRGGQKSCFCHEFVVSVGICGLPPKTGMCEQNLARWHYDIDSGSCREFVYSGCEGNYNNFNTREECESHCPVTRKSPGGSEFHLGCAALAAFESFAWQNNSLNSTRMKLDI